MAFDPPTSPPRRDGEFRSLVQRIFDAPAGTQETDWIEWKSEQLDLKSKIGQLKIAIEIIGFANRDPTRAAAVTDGYAYVVVGAEPGGSRNFGKPIDSADVQTGLERYLGTETAPRWRPHSINMGDGVVFVFEVEPPQPGDPIYCTENAGAISEDRGSKTKTVPSGEIFVRRHGKTERANPDEIRMLSRRLGSHANESPNIEIELISGHELIAVDPETDEFASRTNTIASELLRMADKALAQPKQTTVLTIGPRFGEASSSELSSRHRRFQEDVADFVEESNTYSLLAVVGELASSGKCELKISVTNRSERVVSNAIFSLIAPEGLAISAVLDNAKDYGLAPEPPEVPSRNQFSGLALLSSSSRNLPSLTIPTPKPAEVDGHDFLFREKLGDLHAKESKLLHPVHLLVNRELAGFPFELTWRLTSTNSSLREGEMRFNVDSQVVRGTQLVPDLMRNQETE